MRDDDSLDKLLDGVVGVVEATSFETHCLWKRWHNDLKHSWVQNPSGFGRNIGELAGMPVFLSLLTNTVKGYKILFIEATSQVVDHRMVEQWLKDNLPTTAFDKDGRLNKTDANNFHCVFPYEEHIRKSLVEGIE